MSNCRAFWGGVLVAWVVVLAPATSVFAQTEHRARVCSTRWMGPCSGWDTQEEAPSPANPLDASVVDIAGGNGSSCVWPGGMSVAFNAATHVARPFDIVVSEQTLICAAFGTDASVEALAYYYLDNGQFVFTRTDQPALPGETVQIRMNTEYQITTHPVMNPTEPLIGNDWSQLFFVSLWLGGNGLGNADSFGPPALIRDGEGIPTSQETDWSPGPLTQYLTVPLGAPVSIDMELNVGMGDNYDTCASCQGIGRYESISTMRLRMAPQPFTFSGPGTYTASAPSLLIHANSYPVVAIIDETTTQQELDALVDVDGSIVIDGVPAEGCITFTNLTHVTGQIVAQNTAIECINMPGAVIDGGLIVDGNESDIAIDVGIVGGNLVVDSNLGDIGIDVGNVSGQLVIDECNGSVAIDAGVADGGLVIDSANGDVIVDLGTTNGGLAIDATGGDVLVEVDSLGQGLVLDANDGDAVIVIGNASGDVVADVSNGAIDITLNGDTNGDLTITNGQPDPLRRHLNLVRRFPFAHAFGLPLTYPVTVTINGATVTGNVRTLGVGPTTLTIPGPCVIGGDLEVDNIAQPILNLSQVTVGGRTMLAATGASPILATVAPLDTQVRSGFGTDALDLLLPSGAATPGELLTIQRLGGAETPPQNGIKPDGQPGPLDPFSLYAVDVNGAPLTQSATLMLRLDLISLGATPLQAVTRAIEEDRLTLARRSSPGDPLAALPLCPSGEPLEGCTALRLLDAAGLPTDEVELAAAVEITTKTATFSDWSIVLVYAPGDIPAASTWGLLTIALLLLLAGTLMTMKRSKSIRI